MSPLLLATVAALTVSTGAVLAATLRRPRVPTILQTESGCGAAATLAMALAIHGRCVPIGSLQAELRPGNGRVSFAQLKAAAERRGLVVKARRVDREGLRQLAPGSIVACAGGSLVFCRRVGADLELIDPVLGRHRVPEDELWKMEAEQGRGAGDRLVALSLAAVQES